MPNYYNPGLFYPATYVNPYNIQQPMVSGATNTMQYMINVDGEGSARAWQPPQPVGPNTIIPLWDLDGVHLYFKSTDAYGRMNPIRKARVVFDDEIKETKQALPQGKSETAANYQSQSKSQQEEEISTYSEPDMSQYVTKQDLEGIRQDILGLRSMIAQKNQNRNNRYDQNRGDNG